MPTLNEIAADWWAERMNFTEKREELRAALVDILPAGDFEGLTCYNDYEPKGYLMEAVDRIGARKAFEVKQPPCSSESLFPRKTGLQKFENKLWAKEGYGAGWVAIERVEPNAQAAAWHPLPGELPQDHRVVIVYMVNEFESEQSFGGMYGLGDHRPPYAPETVGQWCVTANPDYEKWGWRIVAWHPLPEPPKVTP